MAQSWEQPELFTKLLLSGPKIDLGTYQNVLHARTAEYEPADHIEIGLKYGTQYVKFSWGSEVDPFGTLKKIVLENEDGTLNWQFVYTGGSPEGSDNAPEDAWCELERAANGCLSDVKIHGQSRHRDSKKFWCRRARQFVRKLGGSIKAVDIWLKDKFEMHDRALAFQVHRPDTEVPVGYCLFSGHGWTVFTSNADYDGRVSIVGRMPSAVFGRLWSFCARGWEADEAKCGVRAERKNGRLEIVRCCKHAES